MMMTMIAAATKSTHCLLVRMVTTLLLLLLGSLAGAAASERSSQGSGAHGEGEDYVYRPEGPPVATAGQVENYYNFLDQQYQDYQRHRSLFLICQDFAAAINTTGYATFQRIVLAPLCPQDGSGGEQTMLPDKVNWIVHAVGADDALEVGMTPPNVFTPVISKGEMRFHLTSAPWRGGEIGYVACGYVRPVCQKRGLREYPEVCSDSYLIIAYLFSLSLISICSVEISFPVGLVKEFLVRGSGSGVQLDLSNPEGSIVNVMGTNNTVSINSTSTVDLSLNNSTNNVVKALAASYPLVNISGASNDVQLDGDVFGGSVSGSSNTLLVQGSFVVPDGSSFDVDGVDNTVKVNGGDCAGIAGVATAGSDSVTAQSTSGSSTCTTTTDVVSVKDIECTVAAGSVEIPCAVAAQIASGATTATSGIASFALAATAAALITTSSLF